jgi:MoaA/NifB/PqqE/SkfB family radical SAM enzyme
VGFACSNRCVFCAQATLRDHAPHVPDSEIHALLDAGSAAVSFMGGEPTLADGLPSWIRHARAKGTERVLLQTNGRRLAYAAYVRELLRAGLTAVEVSLAGPNPAVHDHHTRVPESFHQTRQGIVNARRAGIPVLLTAIVTRSSFRHLTELVRLAAELDAQALQISAARPVGSAYRDLARVVPRFEAMEPYLASAGESARRLGLPLLASGFPTCRLPSTLLALPSGVAQGDPCRACPQAPVCPGVDLAYVERYGTRELSPTDAAPSRAPASLADLCAGLGRTES